MATIERFVGRIGRVLAVPGDQVRGGQRLVEVEPTEAVRPGSR